MAKWASFSGMQTSKCASRVDILLSEWRSALVMKKAGCRLEWIPWQHPLVGSADFAPNHSCGAQKGELINRQNSAKLAAFTLYRASRRHAPYGGTLLVDNYERLIKQFKPIPWSGNRRIDRTCNYIHADAPKEKTQPGR